MNAESQGVGRKSGPFFLSLFALFKHNRFIHSKPLMRRWLWALFACQFPFFFIQAEPLLQRISSLESGLDFTNRIATSRHLTNQVLLNGSGVAAGDIDGDQATDLVFGNLQGPPQLFRNLGHWNFTNITASAGLAEAVTDSTGVLLADVDGDGDLDLVFNTVAQGTYLYLNDGRGNFSKPLGFTPLNGQAGGMSLTLGDIDGDGDLDLYVANYRAATIRDQPNSKFSFRNVQGKPELASINGKPITDPEYTNRFVYTLTASGGKGNFLHYETGLPHALFLNDGKGHFKQESWTGGRFKDEQGATLTSAPYDWGLSASFRDLNHDGFPDLYVCNDFQSPDRIWMNDGRGNFRALSGEAIRHAPYSSMGADFGDLDRDGNDDFLVLDMLSPNHTRRMIQLSDARNDMGSPGYKIDRPQLPQNALYRGRGDGTFAEVAEYAGLAATDWSWAVAFVDLDLDGLEDILITNGFERDNMNMDAVRQMQEAKVGRQLSIAEILDLRRVFPRLNTPNFAYRNLGGFKFKDMSDEWGFNAAAVSQGMCLADLDGDGDLDVVVNNMNDGALLYRNNAKGGRVLVRLQGSLANRQGVGARITVHGGAVPEQSQEIQIGGRYLSSDAAERMFATGTNQTVEIEVRWRSGRQTFAKAVRANTTVTIKETDSQPAETLKTPQHTPFFTEQNPPAWIPSNEMFDDFSRQPLMPYRIGHMGPGVAWLDMDGDGREELVVAPQHNGVTRMFKWVNDQWQGIHTNTPLVVRPGTSMVLLPQGQLWVGVSTWEDGQPAGPGILIYRIKPDGTLEVDGSSLPALGEGSVGPMAVADVDGDGDLDVWVGGRAVAGRWPEPSSGWLYRNEGGKLVLDQALSQPWAKIGLVSGALFADINGDGKPDLVTAMEWGPVRVWLNEGQGRWTEGTDALGLAKDRGWWTSVTAGDLDGDGRLDLVVGNWGANTRYEAWRGGKPLRLYAGDWDNDGITEMIESHLEAGKWVPNRRLDFLSKTLPWLNEKFATHAAYAAATVEEVLGEELLKKSMILEANVLETSIFWNRGGRFERQPLPMEAQVSPVFGVAIADVDGDGRQDVILGQNFFGYQGETPRNDAGLSVWLKNLGQEKFEAVSAEASGIRIWGEARGLATGDFDADGRVDLAVGLNAPEVKVYRNRLGKPGLRVRLKGPPSNPLGVGAKLRLITAGGQYGPLHEVRMGGGYWSVDAATQIMSLEGAQQLEVEWPWGTGKQRVAIPAGTREITVSQVP